MSKKDEHLWLQTPVAVDAPMKLERWTDEDQTKHDEAQVSENPNPLQVTIDWSFVDISKDKARDFLFLWQQTADDSPISEEAPKVKVYTSGCTISLDNIQPHPSQQLAAKPQSRKADPWRSNPYAPSASEEAPKAKIYTAGWTMRFVGKPEQSRYKALDWRTVKLQSTVGFGWRSIIERAAKDLPESTLLAKWKALGIGTRGGEPVAECCGCGEYKPILCDPSEYDPDAPHYCGSSPRCCP